MLTDKIGDMLTRIRNAQMAKKADVIIPYSKFKMEIAKVLEKNGYINKATEEIDEKGFKIIKIILKYKGKIPQIFMLKRISKPGRRIYIKPKDIKKYKGKKGIFIISSSKGILTEKQAIEKNIGGEVLFEIF